MPERYLNLSPVGSGAFGQVTIIMVVVMIMLIGVIMTLHIRYVQLCTPGMFSDRHGAAKREWRRSESGDQKDCTTVSGKLR